MQFLLLMFSLTGGDHLWKKEAYEDMKSIKKSQIIYEIGDIKQVILKS